jgi:microcystin-dependent protein
MSEPFLAEIRIVGFNFAPRGWAFCDGQILPINQNQSLYSLLGTTYGGDGRTSFALPDVRGRVPIHTGQSNGGNNHTLGQKTGEETHTLSEAEIAQHQHPVNGTSNTASEATPTNALLPGANSGKPYNATGTAAMGENTVANMGGGQAHNNMQPFLAMNYCIALQGLFPSRN